MFARYRKNAENSAQPVRPSAGGTTRSAPSELRKAPVEAQQDPKPRAVAAPVASSKEEQRKLRMNKIKSDLHRRLLDNLNLSALENASESELREEINSIVVEALSK